MAWRHDIQDQKHQTDGCAFNSNGEEHDYRVISGGEQVLIRPNGDCTVVKSGAIALYCCVCGDIIPVHKARLDLTFGDANFSSNKTKEKG